jgi:hypothetical protein
MQLIKGRIFKIKDLFILLDMLSEKGGKLTLYLPYRDKEINLCSKGRSFLIEGEGDPTFKFLNFVEEWLLGELPANFELYETEECREGREIEREELFKLLGDPHLKEVKEIPELFEIVSIDIKKAPSFLVAHWTAKKPVERKEVYKHGTTLLQIVKLINSGALSIKPFSAVESLPTKLRLLLICIGAITLLYYLLPLNYFDANLLKINRAVNWALTYKVISEQLPPKVELPVKGCFQSPFFLEGDEVVNLGIDRTLGTRDDTVANLPEKGYKPVYAIPEK